MTNFRYFQDPTWRMTSQPEPARLPPEASSATPHSASLLKLFVRPATQRVLAAFLLLGSMAALLFALSPEAQAKASGPEAPTAVAVYSIESEKLDVRWSSSDAASTTSLKIQWKSGNQEFDSSRQRSSSPSSSIDPLQSTSAGDQYKYTITGLTDGTEYTMRVIATNANGDSDPSGEATGTPQSTPG